jgi:anti-sigma regulatory factor (Ser/Thr protein kinase)
MSSSDLAFTLRNQRSEIARMTALMEQFCAANGISEDDSFNLHLVLDESVINVIVHGYEDGAEHEIRVRLRRLDSQLVIDIEDDGIPYNPLDAPEPRFDLPIEQRRIGGLGVHIMKTLARTIDYKREEGRNHLHIVLETDQDRSAGAV